MDLEKKGNEAGPGGVSQVSSRTHVFKNSSPPRGSRRAADIDQRILDSLPCTVDELFQKFGRIQHRQVWQQILTLQRWAYLVRKTDRGTTFLHPGPRLLEAHS